MRKSLQVLILWVAISPCFAQSTASTKHQHPSQPTGTPTAPDQPREQPSRAEPKPPASIDAKIVSLPVKDWYDKAAVWCTFGLVVVGAGGTFAALRSLRGIREQAGLMRVQASHMQAQSEVLAESVAVAQRSAEAAEATVETMKRADRSWLLERLKFGDGLPRESEGRARSGWPF
jgi:hypothetical protein